MKRFICIVLILALLLTFIHIGYANFSLQESYEAKYEAFLDNAPISEKNSLDTNTFQALLSRPVGDGLLHYGVDTSSYKKYDLVIITAERGDDYVYDSNFWFIKPILGKIKFRVYRGQKRADDIPFDNGFVRRKELIKEAAKCDASVNYYLHGYIDNREGREFGDPEADKNLRRLLWLWRGDDYSPNYSSFFAALQLKAKVEDDEIWVYSHYNHECLCMQKQDSNIFELSSFRVEELSDYEAKEGSTRLFFEIPLSNEAFDNLARLINLEISREP